MDHAANSNELTLIDEILRVVRCEFSLIRITKTMLEKSTIDANQSVQSLFRDSSYFDYSKAIDGEKAYLPAKILTSSGWKLGRTSLYRPKAKPRKAGDPRFWPAGGTKSLVVGDLVFLTVLQGVLVLIPLRTDLLTSEFLHKAFPKSSITVGGGTDVVIDLETSTAVGGAVPNDSLSSQINPLDHQFVLFEETQRGFEKNRVSVSLPIFAPEQAQADELAHESMQVAQTLLDIVRILKDASKVWVPSCSPEKRFHKDVGETLEVRFGVKTNNDQGADYRGVELKTKRRASKTADTLFSQVPEPELSPISTAREIIRSYGYPSRHRSRQGFIDLFVTVTTKPNNQGLYLVVNRENETVEMWSDKKSCVGCNPHLVAVWTFQKLKSRLFEKHPATAWILASESVRDNKIHFRYDGLQITKAPIFSQFLMLIERNLVVFDWRGGINLVGAGQVDKGHAFRLKSAKSRELLFGESEIIDLTAKSLD